MSICLIKEMREDKGISRKQLAEAVGCSYHYIANVENQIIRKPSRDRLIKIADFFGVKFWDLYAEDKTLEHDYEYSFMQSLKLMHESGVIQDECDKVISKYKDVKSSHYDDIRSRIKCMQGGSIVDESSDMVKEKVVGKPNKSTNYVPRLHLMDGYDPSIKERIKAVQGPDMARMKRDIEPKPKDLVRSASDPSKPIEPSKFSQHSSSEDLIDSSANRIRERIAMNQSLEKLGHVVITDEENPRPKDLVRSASEFHSDIRFMQEPKSPIKK